HMVHDSHKLREKLSSRKGIFVIDVRDPGERKLNPVPRSVALHHHDLLSGASCPILPQQKSAAELFVLASNESRGLNSAAALRRWGYDSVVQVDYNTLVEAGYV
nr:Chain Bb, mL94 [Trypanosoma brucei]